MRYFTESTASEYLVAMPKTPVSHIQSTAPDRPGHGCCHADDVACADRGSQGRRERTEMADVALALARSLKERRIALPM